MTILLLWTEEGLRIFLSESFGWLGILGRYLKVSNLKSWLSSGEPPVGDELRV